MNNEDVVQAGFFDLLEIGMVMVLGQHTFEADEIIRFAEKFDPQKFHLSEEGAKKSNFGRLCASGWHTASTWMRKNVENGRPELIRLTNYAGPSPIFGPSPGIRNLRWMAPVFVGDTITYQSTITDKRVMPKRPGWGMMLSRSEGMNQDGKLVLALDGAVLLKMD